MVKTEDTEMKTAKELTREELELLAETVQWALWRDSRKERPYQLFWNPAKECDGDAIEDIEDVADELGLRPSVS